MRLRADLVLLVVSVLWGVAFVFQRVAGLQGSVFLFNTARMFVGAAVLLPFSWPPRFVRGEVRIILLAGTLLFAGSALQQAGLTSTTASNAGFITSIYACLVPFILWLFWREKPTIFAALAVILAGSGAYLLSTQGNYTLHAGDLLELASAVLWALHVIVIAKYAYQFRAGLFTAGQLFLAGFLNMLAGFLFREPVPVLSAGVISAVLYTGVVSFGIGFALQLWAQRHSRPSDAALILGLEAVFAAIAAVFIGESMRGLQIAGALLMLIGAILVQYRGRSAQISPETIR